MHIFNQYYAHIQDNLNMHTFKEIYICTHSRKFTHAHIQDNLYTVRIKKKVIELCSALARLLYNLQKSFFRRWIDQAFSF